MPIQTDLNVAPYYDDYQDQKDFYKILFRPGVAVQARELNQLQTILQRQIERFGDNVFRRGTIIDGCYMLFHDVLPYVKIKDNQTDGAPVNVAQFEGLYIRNQSNLQALVVTTLPGYESRNPDLNTLYIQYVNSGSSLNDTQFAADQILTVFDPRESVSKVNVFNGGSGFSNTDEVVFTSALAVTNSTGGTTFYGGGFATNQVINNGLNANAVIVSVDTTTNTEAVILRIRPLANNLVTSNSDLWTFSANDSIVNANNGQTANVAYLVGAGASATIVTDSVGQIDFVAMTTGGSNYAVKPYVSVASKTANTAETAQANLDPQTYVTQVTVANSITLPVGSGYGMTVGDGVIYQKGYFSRVQKQLVVVEKYNNASSNPPKPDGMVVGFDTDEEIINSSIDSSLLDNSANTFNTAAPGANRLRLTPRLVVKEKTDAEANAEFFAIAEFSEGRPFKQNRQTVYNKIGDEMARRAFEESGNYVLNQFLITTKSESTFTNEDTQFTITVDPGVAYINGYRVETLFNYNIDVDKGTTIYTSNTATVTMNYGNYIRVNQFGGSFLFSTGDLVELYSTAKQYVSGTSTFGTTITPAGTKLGTARIRSVQLESGVHGTPTAIYRLYLFDIKMSAGANFKNVRSVYYNGTYDGIADIVTALDPTTNTYVAVLYDSNRSAMTFYSGVDAVANVQNVSYIYRTVDTGRTANAAGIITKSVTDGTFPYSGTLSAGDKEDLIVVPLANTIATANISGQIDTLSGNAVVVGTGTQFLSDVAVGDWLRVANTSLANTIRQVATIANNTYLTLTQPAGATLTGNATLYFPQNVPVSLERTSRVANVSANGSVLTISLGTTIASDTPVSLTYNVRAANAAYVSKTVNRDVFVRLNLANNAARTSGPWCLGISDVFRLKNVYLGSNNSFGPTDAGVVDITNDFFVDHNQNENFYNTSYLYRKQTATQALTSGSVLLVKVDAFTTTSEGLKHVLSYNINDNVTLDNNTTQVHTMEIPEVFSTRGDYYDLRDHLDFRPVSNNTSTITSTAASATINPTEPVEANRFSSNDKKFPAPDSEVTYTVSFYQPRTDLVVVSSDNNIRVVKGIDGTTRVPEPPRDSLTLSPIVIPPYPSLPAVLSDEMARIVDTRVANEKYTKVRRDRYKVRTPVTADQRSRLQPRGYKMTDIADLERRIRDLEYYVSFTLAEALVMNRSIPGAGGLERFKFGFFADPFSDYTFSDTRNPEFSASILSDKLQPLVSEVNLEFKFNLDNEDTADGVAGEIGTLPWQPKVLVQQLGATDGPVVVPEANTGTGTGTGTETGTGTGTGTGANTVANTTSNGVVNIVTTTQITQTINPVVVRHTNELTNKNGYVWEESEFFMSSLPGPVSLYFNFRDSKMAIEIFYGGTPGFSTEGLTPVYNSLNAVSLTNTDKTLYAYDLGSLESLDSPGLEGTAPYRKWAVEDAGKILWTHDPSLGQYVKIRVTKYRSSGGFLGHKGKGRFAYRLYYPSDSTTQETTTIVSPTAFVYNGTVVSVTPDQLSLQSTQAYGDTWGYYETPYINDSQVFSMVVTGLKPSTIHTFTFDGVDESAKCKQAGKNIGDQLASTPEGTLAFQFYYDAGINEATSDFTQQNALASAAAGVKVFSVESADDTSVASGQITIKAAYQADINNGTTNVANTTSVASSVVPDDNGPNTNDGSNPAGGGLRDIYAGKVQEF